MSTSEAGKQRTALMTHNYRRHTAKRTLTATPARRFRSIRPSTRKPAYPYHLLQHKPRNTTKTPHWPPHATSPPSRVHPSGSPTTTSGPTSTRNVLRRHSKPRSRILDHGVREKLVRCQDGEALSNRSCPHRRQSVLRRRSCMKKTR
jgi:hypothetical protein